MAPRKKKPARHKAVHPLHQHHSITSSFEAHPVLTTAVILMILLLVGLIYVTLISPFVNPV